VTLLAPLFLAGLLAVGLPLWLHRFARDTRTKQPFSSLMLLEQSEIQRSREHTLKYWLLLALRLLLLLLIVFAFAQPMLPWRTPPLEAQDRKLQIVVVDSSLSMQQGNRWQQAVDKAQALIAALKPADRGILVSADSRVRVAAGPVNGGDKAELRNALASLKPGFGRLDYGLLMTTAPAWLGNDTLAPELHVITDLQATATPLQFADLEPPAGVKLILDDVATSAPPNQFVKSIAPSTLDTNVYEVRVGGTADPAAQAAKPRTVVLSIDGKEKGRKPLTDSTVLFSGLDLGAGAHRATISLEPQDALAQDDQFFSVIEHREPRALIIGANAAGDDVSYFAAAVGALTNPRLAVERTGSDAISQRALADYSALVVSDVGVLSGASAGAIQRYLEGGGTVLMTLGPRASRLDRIPLSGHRRSDRSLNSQGGAWTGRVSSVEQSHPALRDAQGWRSVRFFRYVAVEPEDGDAPLIRFEDGHPLLIERHVGAGRLLVLTSPLDREWNDLAIHPLFVRFVGEAARYLTSAASAPNAIVGGALPLGVNGTNGAQVFDPRGRRAIALGDTSGNARVMADQAGFYEVRGGGRSDWIAVNADPRESDLTHLSQDSVNQWTRMQKPATPPPAVAQASTGVAPELKAIWPWLLLIAVTLAFIEPLVANSHLHVRRGVTS
jgi:hypothetical protein